MPDCDVNIKVTYKEVINPKTGVSVGDKPNNKITVILNENNTYEYSIEEG